MKTALISASLLVLTGCSTQVSHAPVWAPTAAEVRSIFEGIRSPYHDPFESHAYADGYISAYCAGPGALGALVSVPEEYQEESLKDAYRRGFAEGGGRAFLTRKMK